MKKYLVLIAVTLGFGCSAVKSDISYQKGKDCFWSGQYDEALSHLNKASELEPTSARIQQQLAMTYDRIGKVGDAWEHARKAYSLDPQSQASFEVFAKVFRTLAAQNKFESHRKPDAANVIEMLGIADKYLHNEQGDLKALYYGPVCLHIDQGKLSSTEWISNLR